MFNMHIQSKLLLRKPVTGSSVWDRIKKGGGHKEHPPALAGTREYKQSDRGW